MFLKNKNIIFKIRRSKVTDYAALTMDYIDNSNELYTKVFVGVVGLNNILFLYISMTGSGSDSELKCYKSHFLNFDVAVVVNVAAFSDNFHNAIFYIALYTCN